MLVIILNSSTAQENLVLYLDSNYQPTNKETEKFIREVRIEKDHYFIADKYLDERIFNYYELSSLNPRIEDGLSIHFDENDNKYSTGNYNNGELTGRWVYYNKNTIDTVYYFQTFDYQFGFFLIHVSF